MSELRFNSLFHSLQCQMNELNEWKKTVIGNPTWLIRIVFYFPSPFWFHTIYFFIYFSLKMWLHETHMKQGDKPMCVCVCVCVWSWNRRMMFIFLFHSHTHKWKIWKFVTKKTSMIGKWIMTKQNLLKKYWFIIICRLMTFYFIWLVRFFVFLVENIKVSMFQDANIYLHCVSKNELIHTHTHTKITTDTNVLYLANSCFEIDWLLKIFGSIHHCTKKQSNRKLNERKI